MNPNELFDSLKGKSRQQANRTIEQICGIIDYFDSEDFTLDLGESQSCKVEYGDWQTNYELAVGVCLLLKEQGCSPEVVIEPTCGTGTFILASAIVFGDSVKEVYGIEIYKPYIHQLKYNLLEYGLKNPGAIKCKIKLFHESIFGFDFDAFKTNHRISKNKNILIVGNPPWVTNSKLGEINSDNLPHKSNFKNVKGLEAITGKANFDIAEYITYQLLDAFHEGAASLAFLIKCSVAKNIVYEQKNGKYQISKMVQYNIDAKKEFDVSVAACLFFAKLGSGRIRQCEVTDFYQPRERIRFGWVDNRFVSNMDDYSSFSFIDGHCQLDWWSGMKHDCSKVMELEDRGGVLFNKLQEEVRIERDLVYPLLKSSDLKGTKIKDCRKYVIVTQRSTSDDTNRIKEQFPLTYQYLEGHSSYFDNRGSVIYKKRPKFCIFGIGAYSFQKYKIAIAGLYKKTSFSLVPPMDGKSVMLDDTCYLMGFEQKEDAECFLKILNSNPVQRFLQSLVFFDAKRSINKDLLMRIDLLSAIHFLFDEKELTQAERDRAVIFIEEHASPSSCHLLF